MKFYSARQAINEAYAIHLKSKGFDVNAIRAPGKPDRDRLIWNAKEAGKVIAQVERLPAHLKAWCYWCYSPLGDTNQGWFKRVALQKQARECRAQADCLADEAASLPERINRCKTESRREELKAIDGDDLMMEAAKLEDLADRLERTLRQPDLCAALWNWLDEQIAAKAPEKMRAKTILRVRDVCRATFYNYRFMMLTGEQKTLVGRKGICEQFGVPTSHFERDYRGWVNWAMGVCDGLDRGGLAGVGGVVDSRCEACLR